MLFDFIHFSFNGGSYQAEDNGCCFYYGVCVIVVVGFWALRCSACITFFCYIYRMFVNLYFCETTTMLSTELQHIKRQKLWVSLETLKTGNIALCLYGFYSHTGIYYFEVGKYSHSIRSMRLNANAFSETKKYVWHCKNWQTL